ncbi:MAG: hypothetical protein ACRDKI_02370 [Solirubrobacterales bacterium]
MNPKRKHSVRALVLTAVISAALAVGFASSASAGTYIGGKDCGNTAAYGTCTYGPVGSINGWTYFSSYVLVSGGTVNHCAAMSGGSYYCSTWATVNSYCLPVNGGNYSAYGYNASASPHHYTLTIYRNPGAGECH